MDLNGKQIILICPKFYGYEDLIAQSLRDKGASVYMVYENLEWVKLTYRLVYVYFPGKKEKMIEKYYQKHLSKILQDADYFFVIRGSSLSPQVMNFVKDNTPADCRFIMYQWDGIRNNESILKIMEHFPSVSSFDYEDAASFKWEYRPLFFVPKYVHSSVEQDIDVLFLCGLHSDRVKILEQLKIIAKEHGYNLRAMMQINKSLYYKNKYIDKKQEVRDANREDVIFKPISIKESYGLYARSKVVVDYTHPSQTGFTMRTIESLGNQCKLITNNTMVKKADFYDPENIYVYDEKNLILPQDFLEQPYKPIDEAVFKKYSLDSWISDLIGE